MFDFITDYLAQAAQGDFFAGGLALGLSGGAIALGRALWLRVRFLVLRRVFVSVTLDNRSGAYRHLMFWIEGTGALGHVRQLRVTDVCRRSGDVFAPAPGRHWFWRDGRLCIFTRVFREQAHVGSEDDRRPMEEVTLTVLFGSVDLIRAWIDDGRGMAARAERKGPRLYRFAHNHWGGRTELPGRSLDTVVDEDGRIARLAADLRRFLGARDWYESRGVPWRRGYLLYGPPGTGKSSLIRALATDLRLDIATVELGRSGMSDEGLRDVMALAPERSLLVIEDIDAVFRERQAGDRSGVSFSGLLNAIDGVAAQEGRALVMTTNHRERLDPALIRPGRADVHVELGPVGASTAAALFVRFFPGEDALAETFREALGEARVTPAVLQGWLLEHADDPKAAATAVGLLPQVNLVAAE